ncbi:hypothetical protein BS50DRAFT_595437 [Corynespora cassiicola Philippines]|uniref:DUF6546 domain-containing protein n=1 Tax=Corynespora cassiicola Philippines TaxID=1448308 RepID=A0A2T2P8E2_CORCC|nr:hypothetical protein BS50DRAFT_595437 [Corynespora cassiicola Philippines]
MTKRHNQIAFPWLLLPAHIRLLILDEISGQEHGGWAQCAAVCKEWQAVLEPKNFFQLALQPSCLDGLEPLVIRQRHLVQHICLNIDLPRYTCPTCKRRAPFSSSRSAIFRRAILRLFSILSTWQPTDRLTLELNASSPSDSQHWFKNYFFGPGHEDTRDWTQQEKAIRWNDPKHGWVDGQQVKTPNPPAILRLFSSLCLNVPQTFPVVHAVTGFCIPLWEKLPRLESIVYELWRYRRQPYQIVCANELAYLIQYCVPKHVKRVSIFKDFSNQLALALNNATPHVSLDIETISAIDLKLAQAFTAKSHHLEHLSISYTIDAQKFFIACQQLLCTWNLLQSLTLTSSTLAWKVPDQNVYTLLRNASSIALKMPQLKTMVLWNSEPGQACAVIYQRNTASTMATLTWRGTWDLELSDDVVESWKKKEALRDVDIRSHGDAIHHLRLPDGVVDQESLFQIRHEGIMQDSSLSDHNQA